MTAPKRGRGRPKGSGQYHTTWHMRLSVEEKAAWEARAMELGITLSGLIRHRMRGYLNDLARAPFAK